mgnify:FL=1
MNFYSSVIKIFASIILATITISCNARVNRNSQKSQVNAQKTPQPKIVYGDLIIKEKSD